MIRNATKSGRALDAEADKKELEAIPYASVQLTHEAMTSRGTGVRRDSYYAVVKFDDYLTHIRFELDRNGAQFGLVCMDEGKTYIPAQLTVQRRVRPLLTRFPARDGMKAVEKHSLELFLTDGIVLVADLDTKDMKDFLTLFQRGLKKPDFAKRWDWFVREASPAEKAEPADNPIE
jgi:hypothetical protein